MTIHLWMKMAPLAGILSAGPAFALDDLPKDGDWGRAAPFEDGQTVCFLGDSITQGALYQLVIEYFYATRHPERNVTFWNAGIAGDTAQSILSAERYRLQDDVLRHQPDVVAIMLGMNDVNRGLYAPGKDPVTSTESRVRAIEDYRVNILRIVDRLEANGVATMFMTPSPYEESGTVTGDAGPWIGVNGALAECAEWIRAQAVERETGLVDFHAALGALNAREQTANPDFSIHKLGRSSGLDRVHPYLSAHWLMAYGFLKAQGFSSLVGMLEIDARAGKAVSTARVSLDGVMMTATGGTFTATAESLPFVVASNGEALLAVVPIDRELSREIVRIVGLDQGAYEIRIEGLPVGAFSNRELARGVDLGRNRLTPQYKQSQRVYEQARARYAVVGRLRNLAARRYEWVKAGGDSDGAAFAAYLSARIAEYREKGSNPAPYEQALADAPLQKELEEEAVELGRRMREAARPVRRSYEIRSVAESTATSAAGSEALAILKPGMEVPLWPAGGMPGPPAAEPQSLNVHQRNWKYTWVPDPGMAIYRPEGARAGLPAVLVCPGGGYGVLAWAKEGVEIAEWLNAIGMAAFVLKYRVPQCRDGALQDLQRAVRLIRAHATEWGVDAARVGTIGFSAGADLCARLCALDHAPAYAAVDHVDQIGSVPDYVMLVYPAFYDRRGRVDKEGLVESWLMPSAGTPPIFLVHTEDDASFVNGTRTYVCRLRELGLAHRFLLYPGGGHGYGLRLQDKPDDLQNWPEQCRQWLRDLGIL